MAPNPERVKREGEQKKRTKAENRKEAAEQTWTETLGVNFNPVFINFKTRS